MDHPVQFVSRRHHATSARIAVGNITRSASSGHRKVRGFVDEESAHHLPDGDHGNERQQRLGDQSYQALHTLLIGWCDAVICLQPILFARPV